MSVHRLPGICLLAAAASLLAGCQLRPEPPAVAGDGDTPAMDTLVSAEWLGRHLDDPDLIVLDCTVLVERDENGGFRVASGRDDYERGHIPGAGFADLMGELSDGSSPLRFALPSPGQFAAAMGRLGISDDSRVVLYDTQNSAWATRVWWMLRWIGFDRAAVLDGGLRAWTAEDRPLASGPVTRPAGKLTLALRPELIADRDEVLASIGDDSVRLIDALSEAQYSGEVSMYGRPGHIPGAVNVPMTSLVDETGRYKSPEELGGIFGADHGTRTITYCGGGIAASSNAFILARLGFENVAVYTASLQEWAADPSNPMETSAGD